MNYSNKQVIKIIKNYAKYNEIKLANGLFVSFNISLLVDSKEKKVLEEFLKEVKRYNE